MTSKKFIQSDQAQAIANRIHYGRMLMQYSSFVTDNPNDPGKATPDRIQKIWGASKPFLDCTEQEAITQYSLVGFRDGVPVVPLSGVTRRYAIPNTVKDVNGVDHPNCIPFPPEGIGGYNLSEFMYQIITIPVML